MSDELPRSSRASDEEQAKARSREYFDRFERAADADARSRRTPPVLWCAQCLRAEIPPLGSLPAQDGRGWAVTVLDGQALCLEHVKAVLQ